MFIALIIQHEVEQRHIRAMIDLCRQGEPIPLLSPKCCSQGASAARGDTSHALRAAGQRQLGQAKVLPAERQPDVQGSHRDCKR